MHTRSLEKWRHDHRFAQDIRKSGEWRTFVVMMITLVMMVAEIIAGMVFGSMALLADGLHMGSHAFALAITVFAYVYARKNAENPTFSFGTGKVNSLGGYTSAVLLGGFAVTMIWSSVDRLIHPVEIVFDWAIAVAVIGLVVNVICAFMLNDDDHHHDHGAAHDHSHADKHHDLNLRSAYMHVIADALTSVLAIAALLVGKYFGAVWLDPCMGLVGAGLILSWAWGLVRQSSAHLLDHQAPKALQSAVIEAIQSVDDARVFDLHVWVIAPSQYAAIIGIVSEQPLTPNEYKARVPKALNITHMTVEVQRCPGSDDGSAC